MQAPGRLRSFLNSSLGSLVRGVVSSASRVRARNLLVLAEMRLLVAGWDSPGQSAPRKRSEMEAAPGSTTAKAGRQAGGGVPVRASAEPGA